VVWQVSTFTFLFRGLILADLKSTKENRSELMKGIRVFGSLLLANFSFSVVQKVLLRNMNLQYSMTLQ